MFRELATNDITIIILQELIIVVLHKSVGQRLEICL